MATSRSTKKRSLDDSRVGFMVSGIVSSAPSSLRSSTTALLLQQQLETVQAELEHERNMRLLDQKRADQTRERLEKQVEWAVDEAKNKSDMFEQLRSEKDKITAKLKQARDQALSELRNVQMELEEIRSHGYGEDDDEEDDLSDEDLPVTSKRYYKHQCHLLRNQLEDRNETEQELRQVIENLKHEVKGLLEPDEKLAIERTPLVTKLLEDAPATVMKELNRTRIELAEAQCANRQLQRRVDELECRSKILIRDREDARITSERVPALQRQVHDLRREYEKAAAENSNWESFGASLCALMQKQGIVVGSEGPPEVSTVLRFLEKTQGHVDSLLEQVKKAESECQDAKKAVLPTEKKLFEYEEKERAWIKDRQDLEEMLSKSNGLVKFQESKIDILKREADSLRSLIKTFDEIPSMGGSTSNTPAKDSLAKALEVGLAAAKQEIDVLKEDNEKLRRDLEDQKKNGKDQSDELERVKEKFGRLREALNAERAKVDEANARAVEAESLAGKGSFNPQRTRVLHVKETPLVEALKEEINVLKRQLDVSKSEKKGQLAPDPEKLNRRLKENFKEQIALFREGVYLMTGYKVDMLPGTDRPTFRVRSMYGEREEDHLMLKWPKVEQATSLDILNSDFARALTTTPSYDYMTKFHSLPAFLASVQLSLFEKQTVAL